MTGDKKPFPTLATEGGLAAKETAQARAGTRCLGLNINADKERQMSSQPDRRIPPAVQAVPVFKIDEAHARQAFEAYAALKQIEHGRPGLSGNPFWQALCDTAFARFHAQYERV